NSSTASADLSNGALTRRMLGLAWRYRRGCLAIIGLQAVLLVLSVAALTVLGSAVDVIRHAVDPASPAARFLFDWQAPADWQPLETAIAAACVVLAIGLVRGVFSFALAVTVAK